MRMAGHWMSEGLKAYPPRCGDCGGGPGESLGCFPQTVSRQVERDGQVLVVLYCGLQPLLTVFGKLLVGQEWYGERDVGLGWAEVLPGQYACRYVIVWLLQRMPVCVW